LNDLINSSDIPDFPNEWMNCLVWSLADQMALDFGVPQNHRQEIGTKALLYRSQMSDFDVEAYSTFFMPDYRSSVSNTFAR
jgi:hypothetical protein